jgi:DNA invertase Pin-like site-specific DNA recombinase
MKRRSRMAQKPKKIGGCTADPFIERGQNGKRALIYARTSTADQDTQNQIVQLKAFAATKGWCIVDEIVDVCSGTLNSTERSGLGKVFALARQRRMDVLLFWSLDRFSREGSRKTIAYLQQLEDFGVDWHSFTEPYISSVGVFSDAIVALLSALAKQERLRIGERTRAGLERAKAIGRKLGRPPTPRCRIEEARSLRDDGFSFSEIGQRMNCSRGRAYQMASLGK